MNDTKDGNKVSAMEAVFGPAYDDVLGNIRELQSKYLKFIEDKM